jgi:U5 small nuclear ribonucleoprotein component
MIWDSINLAYEMVGTLGDPTDTSIKLRPLEPASGQALARDLVLKTRRRKGLGDQIAVSKYLDDEFVVSDSFPLGSKRGK